MICITNFKSCHSDTALNLSIKKQCNLLIGKNGAGKTTLLDYISGIVKKKDVIVTGNEQLVYMNQSMYFFDRLKVRDYVKFIYQLDNIKQYRETLFQFNERFVNHLDLDKIWLRQIGMLSGGEKKLLYFLLIMSLEKEWYLLDEPFAGVDSDGQELMCEMIHDKNFRQKGLVIVLHEEEIIRRLKGYDIIDLNAM